MVPQELHQWRTKQGWTQRHLAEVLGTTTTTVYRYEAGLRKIPGSVVTCLALLAREGQMKKLLETH